MTTAELPAHSHSTRSYSTNYMGAGKGTWGASGDQYADSSAYTNTGSTGGGSAFSILPPYIRGCAHVRAG